LQNGAIISIAVYAKIARLYSEKKHNFVERIFNSMSAKNYAPAYVAGFNQSRKCIRRGQAMCVYVAIDAEDRFVSEISALCEAFGVTLDTSKSKSELGALCGIEVDCAVCAFLK
jgi:large subunit ribosomal protein L7A